MVMWVAALREMPVAPHAGTRSHGVAGAVSSHYRGVITAHLRCIFQPVVYKHPRRTSRKCRQKLHKIPPDDDDDGCRYCCRCERLELVEFSGVPGSSVFLKKKGLVAAWSSGRWDLAAEPAPRFIRGGHPIRISA